MTIEQYIRSFFDIEINDITIQRILEDNGGKALSLPTSLTDKQKDLCLADAYVFASESAVVTSGKSVSDGGWSKKEATKNVEDRAKFLNKALSLYKKWDSPKADTIQKQGIIFKPLY